MTESEKKELDLLIGRIENHRVAIGLSHSRFANRYMRFVGSHKSWEFRLLPRKWDELNPATWLPKLRKFVLELDGAAGGADIFENLPIVKYAAFLFDRLQSQENDRRCAMLIGTQGTGKTMALRAIQQNIDQAKEQLPVFLSANETWKDSRMRIATALALGVNAPVSTSASQTFQNALETLKANPATLLIDEAHEGGVLLMKLVKSIINETRAKVMLSVYPTAWRRLLNGANDAYSEAQQLLRRTIRPVRNDWLNGITEADLAAWFEAAKLPGVKPRAAGLIGIIRRHGNFSLLQDVLTRARVIADEDGVEISAELFCDQLNELCNEAGETRRNK